MFGRPSGKVSRFRVTAQVRRAIIRGFAPPAFHCDVKEMARILVCQNASQGWLAFWFAKMRANGWLVFWSGKMRAMGWLAFCPAKMRATPWLVFSLAKMRVTLGLHLGQGKCEPRGGSHFGQGKCEPRLACIWPGQNASHPLARFLVCRNPF